jgi:hypothetical protein
VEDEGMSTTGNDSERMANLIRSALVGGVEEGASDDPPADLGEMIGLIYALGQAVREGGVITEAAEKIGDGLISISTALDNVAEAIRETRANGGGST